MFWDELGKMSARQQLRTLLLFSAEKQYCGGLGHVRTAVYVTLTLLHAENHRLIAILVNSLPFTPVVHTGTVVHGPDCRNHYVTKAANNGLPRAP